ncbi:MAG: hypothetical protein ACPGOY_01010 [Rhodospirillaceae bacterium]
MKPTLPLMALTLVFGAWMVPTAASANSAEAARENFQQADANNDLKLNADEFKNFIDFNADDSIGNADRVRSFNMYERAFGRIDGNGDGFVTPDEMRAMQ